MILWELFRGGLLDVLTFGCVSRIYIFVYYILPLLFIYFVALVLYIDEMYLDVLWKNHLLTEMKNDRWNCCGWLVLWLVYSTLWMTWKAINALVFRNEKRAVLNVTDDININIFTWIKSKSKFSKNLIDLSGVCHCLLRQTSL